MKSISLPWAVPPKLGGTMFFCRFGKDFLGFSSLFKVNGLNGCREGG